MSWTHQHIKVIIKIYECAAYIHIKNFDIKAPTTIANLAELLETIYALGKIFSINRIKSKSNDKCFNTFGNKLFFPSVSLQFEEDVVSRSCNSTLKRGNTFLRPQNYGLFLFKFISKGQTNQVFQINFLHRFCLFVMVYFIILLKAITCR